MSHSATNGPESLIRLNVMKLFWVLTFMKSHNMFRFVDEPILTFHNILEEMSDDHEEGDDEGGRTFKKSKLKN